jgi:hypothetical protein
VKFKGWMKQHSFPEHHLAFATDLPEGNGVVAVKDLKVILTDTLEILAIANIW